MSSRFTAAILALGLLGFHANAEPALVPLELNEQYISQTWKEHGLPEGVIEGTAGAQRDEQTLLADVSEVDFEDPATVLRMLLSTLRGSVRVLPSERYYYYRFELGARTVSGNLRFVDVEDGVLHMGYFDDHDRSAIRTATFSKNDGVRVEHVCGSTHRVSFEGSSVEFELMKRPLERPQGLDLLPEERFISGVLDESGFHFSLVWNQAHNAFYFLVNEEGGVPDTLIAFGPASGSAYVGKKSRFTFFRDVSHGRLILIGVAAQNIERNNYFDGPFDQVPPRLNIRPEIEAAYPYVRFGGGIDPHGVFNDTPGSRVAISPYSNYRSLAEIEQLVSNHIESGLTGSALWAKLTYESKRDFHLQLEQRAPRRLSDMLAGSRQREHRTFMSQGWPANHNGDVSSGWPASHDAPISGGWPRNHLAADSGTIPFDVRAEEAASRHAVDR